MYYKLQGEEAEDGYDLAKNDFSLVVQIPFQWEMLLKFAQNGICCDSTQDTNGYDFLLTTIHVIDEFGEGVPATWCISSQDVLTTMVIFMNEIKKRCGNIHSQFFMCDMANQFYNAWIAVMESRPQTVTPLYMAC